MYDKLRLVELCSEEMQNGWSETFDLNVSGLKNCTPF